MKLLLAIGFFCLLRSAVSAQTGIGTITPNSTLDVHGSLATQYRPFSVPTTANATDHLLIFNGTVSTLLTLPTAVGCAGRHYLVKNAGSGAPFPLLTINPAPAEMIDGLSSWLLPDPYETVLIVSNGTGWKVISLNRPAIATGVNWIQNGNSLSLLKSIGTLNNNDLPFIANNTEKMRLSAAGSLGIGSSVFDAVNPEKLLVDAGTTTSFTVMAGKADINSYLQLNIQNKSSGNSASSDVVASANNGSELVNYIDLGINSGGFNNSAYPVLDSLNNAYLYSTGNDFIIGNATANKNLTFFTGGYGTANQQMIVNGAGNVGIGNMSPTEKLQVEGNIHLSAINQSIFFDASVDPYSGIKNISRTGEVNELMLFSGNDITGTYGADRIRLAANEIYFSTSPSSSGLNSGDPVSFYSDYSNVPTRMYINGDGNVAIGSTIFNPAKPEQLLVDAGNTASYNVISGKGTYNNYLQLNIQNNSGGGGASSDIVATADNGNETVNYVDLGINSDGYTGTAITGGINNAYLFTTGNDFIIGNATDTRTLIFYTSTAGISTQRMKLTNAGLIPAQNNVYSLGNLSNRSSAVWALNGTIQTSDIRTKTNIRLLSYGLKEVLALRPVSYNWIDEKNQGDKIGLIAQEVKKIIPELVSGNEPTETLGLNYAETLPILVNAVKELNTKLEALRIRARSLHLIK